MSRAAGYAFVIGIAVLSQACASTGATPRPFPTPNVAARPHATVDAPADPSTTVANGAEPTAAIGYSITGTALQLRGTPYRNGGADPSGFDCSGFVQYVFAQHGVFVPRTVTAQFHTGSDIQPAQLEAGDLVFFQTVAPGASHVGIAIGGDEFVHAPSSTGEVRVERLSASYWATRFVGARRVL